MILTHLPLADLHMSDMLFYALAASRRFGCYFADLLFRCLALLAPIAHEVADLHCIHLNESIYRNHHASGQGLETSSGFLHAL